MSKEHYTHITNYNERDTHTENTKIPLEFPFYIILRAKAKHSTNLVELPKSLKHILSVVGIVYTTTRVHVCVSEYASIENSCKVLLKMERNKELKE